MSATIVVGNDGSAPSRSALRWAAQRADGREMGILLCRVAEPELESLHLSSSASWAGALVELEAEAQRVRASFAAVDIRCSVMPGRPVAVLADVARRAGLLVLGTHETGFIQGRAFESRFAALSGPIDTPVAFIPDTDTSRRRGVVARIGRSQSNTAVIRHAATEAQRFDDPVILLGSSEAPLQRAADLVAADFPGLAIRARNVGRGIAHALIDASLSARLLVIGHSADPYRASTVQDVLLNLSCPTMIVHESLTAEGTTACVGSAESA